MYLYDDRLAFGGISERKDLLAREDAEAWHIINVSKSDLDGEDVHIPLNDGAYDGGNSQQQFADAVNAVRQALQSEENVFVHCAVGQSRSVSVLATALAAETKHDYETVQSELMELRGSFTEPAPSLQSKAQKYLRHNRA